MQIWREPDDVPTDLGRTVVTIGNFDGCHLGHQLVLKRAREVADEHGGLPVVALTFDPHPMAVLRPDHAPSMLTDMEERGALLLQHGADHVAAIPFSRKIAAWSPEKFVERIVSGLLGAKAVVVGANFRFGSRAAGDVNTLRELGAAHDFTAEGVALDGGPQVWSSTYVRMCLASGDVTGASEALGRPVTVRGTVVKGDQRGRDLGFPTANVTVSDTGLTPADGVYAGWLRRLDSDEVFPAAISVGTNPTFAGERARRVESYVLDRTDLDLYGVAVEVTFVEHLRGMLRFDGLDDLVVAMKDDVARTRQILDLPAASG